MTFTTNTLALLALVLVLGWVLGLASRSGGAKWRRQYEAEVAARAEDRRAHAAEVTRLEERYRTRDAVVTDRVEPVTPSTLDLTREREEDRRPIV